MAGNETKAGLLAKFGADQATVAAVDEATAAAAAAEAAAEQAGDIGLPPITEPPMQEAQQIPAAFLAAQRQQKANKGLAGAAAANARLNRVVPEAQRVRIYKRLDAGQHMFVGEFTVTEISTGGGNVEGFIRRHLKGWLDPGVNWFRCDTTDAAGVVRQHGEVSVAGDAPVAEKPSTPIVLPTSASPQMDPISEMTRLEELNARRHATWLAQQQQLQEREREMQAAIEKLSQGGGNSMAPIIALMMSQQRQPVAPPTDLRAEAELLDSRIERKLAPMAQTMSAIADRLAALANQPPPMPMAPPPPPPDPLIAITRLMEVMKPTTPPGPSMAEIQMAIQQAVAQAAPKDSFSMRDWLQMQQTEADRRERMLAEERRRQDDERNRLETNMDRRLAELRQTQAMTAPKDGVSGILEAVKAGRELAQVLAPAGEPSGAFDKAIEAAMNPDFWAGLGDFVVNVKGNMAGAPAEDEDEGDQNAIEVEEVPVAPRQARPQPAQRAPQARPAAQPAPQAAPAQAAPQGGKPKPQRARAIRPEDLATQDYPDGFDAMAEQIAGVASKAPQGPEEVQRQIMSVVIALRFCMSKSTVWARRVQGALTRIAMGGPEHVKTWFFPFLGGLAKSGKLPLTSVEILEKTVEDNAQTIVAYIKSKMAQAKNHKPAPAAAPPAQPELPAASA